MPLNRSYRDASELPKELAVFPLEGVLLFPRCELPLNIFESRYLKMFDDALRSERLIGMVQPSASLRTTIHAPALERVGCVGRISQFAESGDGRYIVTLTGVCRFKILSELDTEAAYRFCSVDFDDYENDLRPDPVDDQQRLKAVLDVLKMFEESRGLKIDWSSLSGTRAEPLLNALCMQLPLGPREKQALLEASNLDARISVLSAIAEFEVAGGPNPSTRLQ
jgi:uncharacterized protein